VARLGHRSVPALRKLELTRRFVEALYVPGLDELLTGPSPLVLDTEMPSVNGLLSAHALAKLYAALADDGAVEGGRLLSAATVRELSQVQTTARDAVIGMRMLWRLGYHRAGAQGYRAPRPSDIAATADRAVGPTAPRGCPSASSPTT
jgi:hypothetical protein